MQILGNIFSAVIFVSIIGSLFTVLSLFVNCILRCTLPLWFSVCGMILFFVPILSPEVILVSPEAQDWLNGFRIAAIIWLCGLCILSACAMIRFMLGKRAVKNYRFCRDERINLLYYQCAKAMSLQKVPVLYFGALDNPICVTDIVRPAIIMNETIVKQLSDKDLAVVFSHELTHVKRKHILLERIYAYVCILNWINPFSWIAKENFSLHCETDCDLSAMKILQGKVTETEYASAIIRLLELSAENTVGGVANAKNGIGALDFLLTKRSRIL